MFFIYLNFLYKEEKAMALRRVVVLAVLLTALLGAVRKMQNGNLKNVPAAARVVFDWVWLVGDLWGSCDVGDCDRPLLFWGAAAQQMMAMGKCLVDGLLVLLASEKYFGTHNPSIVR